MEIICKVTHITDRADDTKFIGRMHVGRNQQNVEFVACDATPGLSDRNPKQLLRIIFESWQNLFRAVTLDPSGVCPICFFNAPIVGNILALCIDAVQL